MTVRKFVLQVTWMEVASLAVMGALIGAGLTGLLLGVRFGRAMIGPFGAPNIGCLVFGSLGLAGMLLSLYLRGLKASASADQVAGHARRDGSF